MKKRTFKIILSFAMGLLPNSLIHADAMDDSIDIARAMRDSLAKEFEPFVRGSVIVGIHNRLIHNQWDYVAVRRELAMRASNGIQTANKIRSDFDLLQSSLFSSDTNWDDNASELMALVAQAQNLNTYAMYIEADGNTLKSAWEEACVDDKIQDLVNYYTPLTIQSLFTTSGVPSGAYPNFEFNVQVGFGGGTVGTPPDPSTVNDGVTIDEAIDYIGGTAISIVAAESLGMAAAVNPALLAAAPYVAIAYVVYRIIDAGLDAMEVADKKIELQNLNQDIQNIQLNAIRLVHSETPGHIREICTRTFPRDLSVKMQPEIYAEFSAITKDLLEYVKNGRDRVLTQYRERYADLQNNYYPRVQSQFLGLIEERLAQQNVIAAQIENLIQNILAPQTEEFSRNKDAGGTTEWRSKHKLWSTIIQADARFRTRSDYSFIRLDETPNTPPSFDNLWNNLGPQLSGVLR